MKKSVLLFLLLLLSSLLLCAFAEQGNYCDPVPQGLADLIEGTPQDCIVFNAPDGSVQAYIITECASGLDGYRLTDGQWEMMLGGGDVLDYRSDARFVRHQPDQLRPDGVPYGDSQGFDIAAEGGICDCYQWNGEYYALCGWHDPDRYSGTVMIQGTVLKYYPEGSTVPEYEADAGDELTMSGWTDDYKGRPATPAEAKKRAVFTLDSIRNDVPGAELAEYIFFNWGTEAQAVFAAVKYNEEAKGYVLSVVKAAYNTEWEKPEMVTLADIPLSEQMKDVSGKDLWENNELLRQPGAIDTGRLPVKDRVVSLEPYQGYLVLLTEDEEGQRRVAVAYQAPGGTYTVEESNVLPDDSWLDLFHAGQDQIQFEFNQHTWEAGFYRTDSGWQLKWVFGDGVEYTVYWGNIRCSGHISDEDSRLVGTLDNYDLMTVDFTDIPRTIDTLKQAVSREGWAAVCNPNPKDRLYLRPKAGDKDSSLGKFYNGTPVRVLETKKDWCRVKIGANGPEGWMMKKYLVFGEKMDSVEPAFPFLDLREEYMETAEGWTEPEKKNSCGLLKDHTWHIMGVFENLYILIDDEGECAYAPMAWFWEGNG